MTFFKINLNNEDYAFSQNPTPSRQLISHLSFVVVNNRQLSLVDGPLHVDQALLPVVALVVHPELSPE